MEYYFWKSENSFFQNYSRTEVVPCKENAVLSCNCVFQIFAYILLFQICHAMLPSSVNLASLAWLCWMIIMFNSWFLILRYFYRNLWCSFSALHQVFWGGNTVTALESLGKFLYRTFLPYKLHQVSNIQSMYNYYYQCKAWKWLWNVGFHAHSIYSWTPTPTPIHSILLSASALSVKPS